MKKLALIGLGVLVALAVISQFALPGLAESQIEDRLTEEGGRAEADLSAFPAARLLFEDGGEIDVSGSGLELELDEDPEVFSKLDGFDEVRLAISDSTAGPLDIASFDLSRSGQEPYSVVAELETTGADLLAFGADSLGLPGGGIAGFFAGRTDAGAEPIPISIDMEMTSEDGRVQVTDGGGEVAGVPTGPLAELITAAIVVRI